MAGVTKAQAVRALAAGWRKDTLLALNQIMRCGEKGGDFIADWAFVTEPDPSCGLMSKRIIYRSYTPADVENSFLQAPDTEIEVTAFADGSGNTFDKPAGIGVVIYRPWAQTEFVAEHIGLGTNNRAELCAIWRGLRAVPDTAQALLIKSDSQYAIGALTKEWMRNKNAELIENIRKDLGLRLAVRFEHVDGHSGHEGNEVADRLAKIGCKLVTKVSLYEG
jgi:ribonuclease HI